MDLAQLIRLGITASILLLVFALGLRATVEDTTYLFRRPARFFRGFLAMGVIVPVVAAALAALFRFTPAVEIAILAMAVSPVPPILPSKQFKLGGRSRYVFGLLVAASLVAIVFVPLAIEVLGWLFRSKAHIGAGAVARVVGVTVLLPLAAGLTVNRVAPLVAERIAPLAAASATCCCSPGSRGVSGMRAPAPDAVGQRHDQVDQDEQEHGRRHQLLVGEVQPGDGRATPGWRIEAAIASAVRSSGCSVRRASDLPGAPPPPRQR